MFGSVLEEKSAFKMLDLSFPVKLDLGSYLVSLVKTVSTEIGAWIRSIKFLSLEVVLCLYKSTLRQCMEYCCHVLAGAPKRDLNILHMFQKRVCKAVGPALEPLAHLPDVVSLSPFQSKLLS